ncbi:MAG: hypothetical protein LUC44_06830 [Prevotellaceae bacterium]|nr:hypothetical protein [Prevotellaceae bacterium]
MGTRSPRIQNSICRSRALLTCCTLAAMALWCLPLGESLIDSAVGFVLTALTAYGVAELCNSNSLFRVYTRSASSLYILSAACMGFLHPWQPATAGALSLIAAMYLTFGVDRRKNHIVDTFHIMAFVGIACVFLPQLVVLLPLYYIFVIVLLRSFSSRVFLAGVVGFALPCCAALGVCRLTGGMALAEAWRTSLVTFYPIRADSYLGIDPLVACLWAAVLALALWCAVYYIAASHRDKIRVRTLFFVLLSQAAVITLLAGLQPQHAHSLLPAMMVSVSPLVAHYFTLSDTWLCTVVFFLTVLLLCGAALFTLTHIPQNVVNLINSNFN